jgi:hypothetical protein
MNNLHQTLSVTKQAEVHLSCFVSYCACSQPNYRTFDSLSDSSARSNPVRASVLSVDVGVSEWWGAGSPHEFS